jgi:hypothetical protein
MRQDVYDAIVRMALENGIDPAYALAYAQRESDFNVQAGSGSPYSSAYGIFQMLRSERARYGGSSSDPYEQSNAWAQYIAPTRDRMADVLGRDPSGSELYLGHYFGPGRAARMVSGQIPAETPVEDVFSPRELAANPNIARAGTVGRLTSSIQADVDQRAARFGANPGAYTAGGTPAGSPDFTQYGDAHDWETPDFSQGGEAHEWQPNQAVAQNAPSPSPDAGSGSPYVPSPPTANYDTQFSPDVGQSGVSGGGSPGNAFGAALSSLGKPQEQPQGPQFMPVPDYAAASRALAAQLLNKPAGGPGADQQGIPDWEKVEGELPQPA